MRVRRRQSPLLLLLFSSLVSSLSTPQKPLDGRFEAIAQRDVELKEDYPAIANAPGSLGSITKSAGTKDAPVDGLDGKPHAGPWVGIEAETEKKKLAAGGTLEETEIKKPEPTTLRKLKEGGYSGQGQSAKDMNWEDIPENNDGVMDDKYRATPKQGTTGTEGGVSEKSKSAKEKELATGEKVEKTPDPPKEAPPLPHSEEERIKGKTDGISEKDKIAEKAGAVAEKAKGAIGLEKPNDLPENPHSSKKTTESDPPHDGTVPERSSKLMDTMPYTEGMKRPAAPGEVPTEEEEEGLIQPLHSFVLSFVMILFSEVGDKTFLVAALMAMRHDRLVVFSAAFSALITMTVLSAVLGHAVPTLLPKRFVAFAAAILFLVFGAKLMREGLAMPKDMGVGEEMREVEAELEEKENLARKSGRRRSSLSPYLLESGRGRRSGSRGAATLPAPPQSPPSSDSSRSPSPSRKGASVSNMLGGLNNLFSLVLSPAWVQTFIMTFLGEWGDRSQIATIAMAAGQDYWWVTGGAISGHGICTGVAVLGGRALAGKVSMRVVTLGGAIAFLVFGVIYLFEAVYTDA